MDPLTREKEKLYNLLAAFYDRLFFVLRPGHKLVGRYLASEKINNVLEVGTGTGLTFEHYKSGTHITAVDLSEGMLKKAREKTKDYPHLNIDIFQMDAQSLTYEDNVFSCSYAPSLLTVVPDPDKLLSEMVRVTKPGGKIIVTSHFQGDAMKDALAAKLLGPVTQKLFGFRMDLPVEFIEKFSNVKLVMRKKVNPIGPFFLSHLVVLEKTG